MSYNEDYKDAYHKTEKIPFDDTPIVRIPQVKKNVSIFNKPKNTSQKKPAAFKTLVACVAILLIVNVALSAVVVWALTHAGSQNINVYQNSISVSGDSKISEYAYQTARFNSVCISASDTNISSSSTFFGNARSRGSGVIYKKDESKGVAYILTCYHVIQGYENNVYALFTGYGKPIKATRVGYSRDYDVAVLRVDDLKNIKACQAIQIQDSQTLVYGEAVLAVGNSLSGGLSMSSGVISRINKEISVDGYLRREIQTDAAINPGNSGGGLFDAEGKFIGLVNAKQTSSTSGSTTTPVEGTAYAIPGNLAIGIAESIIQNNGRPTMIKLDVDFTEDENYPMSPDEVTHVDKYRVVVDYVKSGSIASGKLTGKNLLGIYTMEIVSFKFLSIRDNEWHEVKMYNKFCFDDYCFEIVKGSILEFTVLESGKDTTSVVTVIASALYTPN